MSPNDPQPTMEQMAMTILRGLYDAINSRETEVPIDEASESPDAPSKKIRGVVWHDKEDPIISLTGDWGAGSVTLYYGTMGKPFARHTHAGHACEDPDQGFIFFAKGLYLHFLGGGLSFDIPITTTEEAQS